MHEKRKRCVVPGIEISDRSSSSEEEEILKNVNDSAPVNFVDYQEVQRRKRCVAKQKHSKSAEDVELVIGEAPSYLTADSITLEQRSEVPAAVPSPAAPHGSTSSSRVSSNLINTR